MPSPFPGMDPWVEDPEIFPNFHERMVVAIQDALNDKLPRGYVATTRTRVYVESDAQREPDIAVLANPVRPRGAATALKLTGLTAVASHPTSDPIEEPYLQIVTQRGKRVVTAVEMISPANKSGGRYGRKAYRAKQREYARGGVHLVEIDLLRGGPHVTAVPKANLHFAAGTYDYHVCASVAAAGPRYFVAGIRLRDRLPVFGIPLDAGMAAVDVDLQSMLDAAYDRCRFAELIDYTQPPYTPLKRGQAVWADAVLNRNPKLKP